jgi:probable F420-dependent oxidoreductase
MRNQTTGERNDRESYMIASGQPSTAPAGVTEPQSGSPRIGLRSAVWLKSGLNAFPVVLDLAEEAERRGFDAIFFGDRMLAEVGHGGQGVYNSTHTEIFTTLSAIAARTSRVLLGSLILVVPFRHPVPLAKTIASVDLLSEGRLLLGIGAGWNPKEFEVLGVEKGDAAEIMEESTAVMKQLWTGAPVTFEGRFHSLDEVAVEPTPFRPGGPPIWMGGFSPLQRRIWEGEIVPSTDAALRRVGRMADTWVPLLYSTRYRHSIDPLVLGEAWRRVKAAARDAGRPDDAVTFAFSHWYYVLETDEDEADARRDLAAFFPGTFEEARDTYLIGTPDEIVDKIRYLSSDIDAPDWIVFTQLGNNPRQLDLLDSKVLPQLRSGR